MQDLVLNNRYRIEKLIGQGGMADVYLGRDTLLDRLVAIKVLHPDLANDQTFIENFRREARAAAKLVHPNIVGIYDVGEDQGFHYIVLEYVPGHTLKDELEAGDLTPKQALSIALDVAEGLQEAHRHGFIHCDIKPQNILLLPSGIAKITDFGIARLTTSTSTLVFGNQDIMGTAHYLS
ncbi:MAG: serine/threonine protein kinase, partial [Negativicutes bacterium]|nr:serine/threonine protein kinase [Negativicutes bacterium]